MRSRPRAIEAVEALRRERMSGPAIARELGLPRVAIGRPPAQVARITLTQFWHGAAGSGVKVPPAKVAPRRAPRIQIIGGACRHLDVCHPSIPARRAKRSKV